MDGDKNVLVSYLEQKVAEKAKHEERLTKICEELRESRNALGGGKVEHYDALMHEMFSFVKGNVITSFLLEETTKRLRDLTFVAGNQGGPYVGLGLPLPKDEFTMMAFDDVNRNIQKFSEQNKEMETLIQKIFEDTKIAGSNADIECKEITENNKKFAEYVTEIRGEEAKLDRELAKLNGAENTNQTATNTIECSPDLAMAGLESGITELLKKLKDQMP